MSTVLQKVMKQGIRFCMREHYKDSVYVYRIRSNFRTTKFTKMTALQAFQNNIFENQRKLTI